MGEAVATFRIGDVVADTLERDRPFCVVDEVCDGGVLIVAWLHRNGCVRSGGLHPRNAKLLLRPGTSAAPTTEEDR